MIAWTAQGIGTLKAVSFPRVLTPADETYA
jgi:hypothetical protein